MGKGLAVATKNQSSSGQPTKRMSMRLALARKSQSSSGPMTRAMAMGLTIARKSQSSSSRVTKAMATCLAVGKKSPTAKATQLSVPRRKIPSGPVTRAAAICLAVANSGHSLSHQATTAMATGLADIKKSQSMPDLVTAPTAKHLVAAKKSHSLSGQMMAAIPTQLAVTSKGQSSSCPMTTDGATSSTTATTGQSSSVDTSNMKEPVTETTNKETPVTEEMTKNRQLTGKKRPERQLRFSLRLIESPSRFKDIVVRKQDGFTHIFLSTKSSPNNSLNLEVMTEIQNALNKAAEDDSKLVLLGAIGSVFCFGLDFSYFIQHLRGNKKSESTRMSGSIKKFVNTFIQFKKPIIAAVNGPALGLGASILPLCDVVWANEKAWFQTPYTTFGQSPDGCSSFTFPKMMGQASANEMLLSGRKLTAQEACEKGLVSQVFWPQTFSQEVMIRVKEMASCDAVVLQESKALLRFNTKTELEQANERECRGLKDIWGSVAGIEAMFKYLQNKIDY
ncbi:chromodomain Y-like protein [Mesocricetus auratus]|uniref:Chromodomain Y-like protein n=1 Tax=Mesocricetus auratus TaxID=10036 RepID=A0ABM2XBG8_MESAU|nr:chromodomain Y-like protein [Mesocricetus auratus]